MPDRIFDVEITITKTVRVRIPDDMKNHPPRTPDEESAEELALGGKAAWPEYVLSEDEDFEVESVREVKQAAAA